MATIYTTRFYLQQEASYLQQDASNTQEIIYNTVSTQVQRQEYTRSATTRCQKMRDKQQMENKKLKTRQQVGGRQ
jgi:hypothetical protein